MSDLPPVVLTPEELAARKRRNAWLAAGLVSFMIIVVLVTIFRLGAGVARTWG